jgi:hypothetical protein
MYANLPKPAIPSAEMIEELVALRPQVIILDIEVPEMAPFILNMKTRLPDVNFIIPGLVAEGAAMPYALTMPNETANVYSVAGVPPFSDTEDPLVQEMIRIVNKWDPAVLGEGMAFGFQPAMGLMGFFRSFLWLQPILETMEEATWEDFLDSVYLHNALSVVASTAVGPFYDASQILQPPCNQGGHTAYITELKPVVPGAFSEWRTRVKTFWEGCNSFENSDRAPILLGFVTHSEIETELARAIQVGLDDSPDIEAAKVIDYAAYGGNTTTDIGSSLLDELLNIDFVSVMVTTRPESRQQTLQDNVSTWDIPPTSLETFNVIDSQLGAFNFFPTLRDRVYTVLSHLQKDDTWSGEVVVVGSAGRVAIDFWRGEFDLVGVLELETLPPTDPRRGPIIVCKIPTATEISYLQSYGSRVYLTESYLIPEYSLLDLPIAVYSIALPTEDMLALNSTASQEVVRQQSFNASHIGLEYSGYLLGRFYGRLFSSINGDITRERITEAVYDIGVFRFFEDLTAGPFQRGICNRGLRSLVLHRIPATSGEAIEEVDRWSWDTCGLTITSTETENEEDSEEALAAALAGSLSGVLVMVMCCFLVLACVIVVVLTLGLILATTIAMSSLYASRKYKNRLAVEETVFEPDYLSQLRAVQETPHAEKIEVHSWITLSYGTGGVSNSNMKRDMSLFAEMLQDPIVKRHLICFIANCNPDSKSIPIWLYNAMSFHRQPIELLHILIDNETASSSFYDMEGGSHSKQPSESLLERLRSDSIMFKIYKIFATSYYPYLWEILGPQIDIIERSIQANSDMNAPDAGFKLRNLGPLEDQESSEGTFEFHQFKNKAEPVEHHVMTNADQRHLEATIQLLGFHGQNIINSLLDVPFPSGIASICARLGERMVENEESIDDIRSAIATFIFLHFLCPVLTEPEEYGMAELDVLDKRTKTLLVSLGKILQKLANNSFFSDKSYLSPMTPFIQKNRAVLNEFFDGLAMMNISSSTDSSETGNSHKTKPLRGSNVAEAGTYEISATTEVDYNLAISGLYMTVSENNNALCLRLKKELTRTQFDSIATRYLSKLKLYTEDSQSSEESQPEILIEENSEEEPAPPKKRTRSSKNH